MHFSIAFGTLNFATSKKYDFLQIEWGPFFAISDQNKPLRNDHLQLKYRDFCSKTRIFYIFYVFSNFLIGEVRKNVLRNRLLRS